MLAKTKKRSIAVDFPLFSFSKKAKTLIYSSYLQGLSLEEISMRVMENTGDSPVEAEISALIDAINIVKGV